MKSLKLVIFAVGLCLTQQSGVQPIQAASPVLGVLQTELQRNFSVLNKEQTPAYFMGYTVHEDHLHAPGVTSCPKMSENPVM